MEIDIEHVGDREPVSVVLIGSKRRGESDCISLTFALLLLLLGFVLNGLKIGVNEGEVIEDEVGDGDKDGEDIGCEWGNVTNHRIH